MNNNPSYHIIFAGTPPFSARILDALIHSEHKIIAAYTQPDRPAGRGRKLTASPVKELALKHEIPVYQPSSLRNEIEQQKLADLNADLMVVVAYGLILPKAVLSAPKLGCINIHASLLPRWRGAAPIQRAILAGDEETGITTMQMDEGLDTGNMLLMHPCPITLHDTSATLHDRLSEIGAEAILKTLEQLPSIEPQVQNDADATYAHKIKKEEAELDWNLPARELNLKIRAFNPWPVAFYKDLRIWEAFFIEREDENALPGTILNASAEGIEIKTGKGILNLQKLQLPGGKVLSAREILNGQKHPFKVGVKL